MNDPNLKRIEGRIGYGKTEYGFKAELLMVTDGGHVSNEATINSFQILFVRQDCVLLLVH